MVNWLNKTQKDILKQLNNDYPHGIAKDILLQRTGRTENELLSDVKILDSAGLIRTIYEVGAFFPPHLEITEMGREKLRETLLTRLKDTTYNNPWVIITVITSIISVILSILYLSGA